MAGKSPKQGDDLGLRPAQDDIADAAALIDGGDFAACSFPMDLGPEAFTFICNAESSVHCEVSNRPSSTNNLCRDMGSADFTFDHDTGGASGSSVATVGTFTFSSAGTLVGSGKRIIDIPSDAAVGALVDLNGTEYFLDFKCNTASNTLTISSFEGDSTGLGSRWEQRFKMARLRRMQNYSSRTSRECPQSAQTSNGAMAGDVATCNDTKALAADALGGLELDFQVIPVEGVLAFQPTLLISREVELEIVDFSGHLQFYFR